MEKQRREDVHLVTRFLAGETGAFSKLARKYDALVRRVIQQTELHSGKRVDVDEVAQEAICTAYRNLPKLNDPARFESWLWGITIRTCKRWARRSRQLAPIGSIEEMPDHRHGTFENRRELYDRIVSTLNDLPTPYVKVLELRYLERLPYKKIARTLGVPETTVRGRIERGTRVLRERLLCVWREWNHR